MIVLWNREEQDIIKRLRQLGNQDTVPGLTAEVVKLKTEIASLTIKESALTESFERRERELRHMIGLEQKRQVVEMEQARRGAELDVKAANLEADKKRFAEQLEFNTKRFEAETQSLKQMLALVVERLPDVNLSIKQRNKGLE